MQRSRRTTLDDVVRTSRNENRYDYIIVGSGMGGGTLARTLVESSDKRVLLIERGEVLFNTHCLNTARRHWAHDIPTGPSQDNDVVYRAVKEQVPTAGGSHEYSGGPVYSLGGRSNVWGLYSPRLQEKWVREHFPREVASDLFKIEDGTSLYERAYQLVTANSASRHDKPYPEGRLTNYQYLADTKAALREQTGLTFSCAPMAAEFITPQPGRDLYRFPAGAYSTVDWLLERIYNSDQRLTVLLETEVLTVDQRLDTRNDRRVNGLTVRQKGTVGQISTASVKAIILCAGTIDTAHIAIRSGFKEGNNCVGRGLTDHAIWGTRFEVLRKPDDIVTPLKLQAWWEPPRTCRSCSCSCPCGSDCSCSQPPSECECSSYQSGCTCPRSQRRRRLDGTSPHVGCQGTHGGTTGYHTRDPVLLNICINANTFLGHSLERNFPVQIFSERGDFLSRNRSADQQRNTVNITFSFSSNLEEENCVLNLSQPTPALDISCINDNSDCREAMGRLASKIRKSLESKLFAENADVDDRGFDFNHAGFGAVAHEVGTMRMGGDGEEGVVDHNLKVKKWDNLFVCDLSVFSASPAANPSLTLVALALRLAKYLLRNAE